MKTLQAIVELAQASPPGEVLALATVVKTRGSAYRRPGARMLVTPAGRSAGLISGGCLDGDVRERAQAVLASGRPCLVTYDSRSPADIVFGLGLGCSGIVQVLLEPVTAGDPAGLLAFLTACVNRRQVGRIATIFHETSAYLASRVLRWPDGALTSTCADDVVAAALLQLWQESASRRTALREMVLPDGQTAGVLLEAITPPVALTIFGAADDALPVAHLAKSIGWHVTVIDARPAYATPERFPTADAVHCLRPGALSESPQIVLTPESMVMIMTHHFNHDRDLLRFLLPRPPCYLGILGPKARTARLLEELAEEGLRFPDDTLAKIHGPAGLDLGAETPEEIAISIIGEMQSVLAQRGGGALRDRNAPIHDPVDQPIPLA